MDLGIPGCIFSYLDLFEWLNVTGEVQYCFRFVVVKHIFHVKGGGGGSWVWDSQGKEVRRGRGQYFPSPGAASTLYIGLDQKVDSVRNSQTLRVRVDSVCVSVCQSVRGGE